MESKIKNLIIILKKYIKYFLLVTVIIGVLIVFLILYLFRNYIYQNEYITNLFSSEKSVATEFPVVNNKIVNEESVIVDVVERVGNSVVSILILDDIFSEDGEPVGSGVIVTSDGLIVTNKHVIEDEGVYQVVLQDGKKFNVSEVIKDKTKDLALIKIEANDLAPVTLGDSKNIKLGQKAIAVGNAIGLSNTVSVGIVSGLSREVEVEGEVTKNLIQTDAAINPGNSGGALLNSSGELVGINTARSSYAENIGFAIPVNTVRDLVEKYQSGKISKDTVPAFLGVGFVFKDLKEYVKRGLPIGPVITGVLRNSPADKAGVKVGDIIVSIDGSEFSDEYELSQFIKEKNPGDEIRIKVYRKNSTLDLSATLAEAIK
jgi:serine protease Do